MSIQEIRRPKGISVEVEISMPEPGAERPVCDYREEDEIEAAIEMVDSGHESREQWKYLRWINNSLVTKYEKGTINRRELKVLKMIQPIMEKYGQLDPEGIKQNARLHTTQQQGK